MKKIILCLAVVLTLLSCSTNEKKNSNKDVDLVAPYINLKVFEFTTTCGERVDVSTISGYDDVDGLLQVSLEGYIDYNKPGIYYPSVVCSDLSGNTTMIPVTVHVLSGKIKGHPSEEKEEVINEIYDLNEGCDLKGAISNDIPCDAVVPNTLEKYEYVFATEEGYEQAKKIASDEDQIEKINRNNGEFFGYGILKSE